MLHSGGIHRNPRLIPTLKAHGSGCVSFFLSVVIVELVVKSALYDFCFLVRDNFDFWSNLL